MVLSAASSYLVARMLSTQQPLVQVSLPHYADPDFHVDSVRRYKMYLRLKKKNVKTFLVPCYDMDLVWHAHQVRLDKQTFIQSVRKTDRQTDE
jgi:hypothetical protein